MQQQHTDTGTSLLERDYVSLAEVSQFFKEAFVFPYESRFSFQPYLEEMKGKMTGACDFTKSALHPVMTEYNDFVEQQSFDIEISKDRPEFQALVSLIVPTMILHDNLNFISKPFGKDFLVATERFREFFDGDVWELKLIPELLLESSQKGVQDIFTCILNRFYNQNIEETYYETLIFRNRDTLVERYFHLKVNLDFIDVKVNGQLPELTQSQINHLINNSGDADLLLATFPRELFEFYGYTMGSLVDVTDVEVLRELRQYVSSVDSDLDLKTFHTRVEGLMRSYLNKPAVSLGEAIFDKRNYHAGHILSLTGLSGVELRALSIKKTAVGSLYHKALVDKKTVVCEDIQALSGRFTAEDALLKKGFRSMILHPILDSQGRIQNVLEVGSKNPLSFNALTVRKIESMFSIIDDGYRDFIAHLDNEISNVIKDKFTSIHSSVEWKFEEVATTFFNERLQGNDIDMPPVLFEDLHPLYGQSDIVASSGIRSTAIQNDLINNLELVLVLMDKWLGKKQIHILESFKLKVEKLLERIRTDFKSSDETDTVALLNGEIHPLLHQLEERHGELSSKAYRVYFDSLDEQYGIIYNERKSYEISVNKLNNAIASFLEAEDGKMQSTLPHYFEKYKTDGVEYNMYLGQSLLPKGTFTKYDLENFKIWQLTNMVQIVKLVEDMSTRLPVPLQTAQLIFVYSQPLSIRFRMDEKKFDVDGAYNVRYEILKKRVDKALILGTGERLTVAGKIAIVYLNDSDKAEYLGYIDYLKEKGMITGEVEDLELEKLQGADGLKALRISVA